MIIVLFGAVGGGSDSNSYTPVSAEEETYEPIIQKYAQEYGTTECYVVRSSSIYGYSVPQY